jgi:hypothetical protein
MNGDENPTFDLVPVVRKGGRFHSVWYQSYRMPLDAIQNVEPVVYRPFAGLSLPTPNNIGVIYNERLTFADVVGVCKISNVHHFDGRRAKAAKTYSVPCQALHHVLPMAQKIVEAELGGDAYYVELFGIPANRSYQLWLTPRGRGGASALLAERQARQRQLSSAASVASRWHSRPMRSTAETPAADAGRLKRCCWYGRPV